jgi:hypothetical protein
LKKDRHPGGRRRIILDGVGFVNELGYLVETELFGAFARDKEHGVNDVALAAAVGADDGGKTLVKGTNLFDTGVAFKVLQFL